MRAIVNIWPVGIYGRGRVREKKGTKNENIKNGKLGGKKLGISRTYARVINIFFCFL